MSGSIAVAERGRVLVATLSNPPPGLFDDSLVAALDELVARAEVRRRSSEGAHDVHDEGATASA